ncbi:hypothetical protein [Candidatus Odyssella thessalonicensis]|uniref:hypothetical protein n=1 Tax=Candidatus Odyssella thessalonicensis TaxID=84647 RepID=UPI000225B1D3|nr:hypothetical protein [Candidatus Odyssella thessalonicensis]
MHKLTQFLLATFLTATPLLAMERPDSAVREREHPQVESESSIPFEQNTGDDKLYHKFIAHLDFGYHHNFPSSMSLYAPRIGYQSNPEASKNLYVHVGTIFRNKLEVFVFCNMKVQHLALSIFANELDAVHLTHFFTQLLGGKESEFAVTNLGKFLTLKDTNYILPSFPMQVISAALTYRPRSGLTVLQELTQALDLPHTDQKTPLRALRRHKNTKDTDYNYEDVKPGRKIFTYLDSIEITEEGIMKVVIETRKLQNLEVPLIDFKTVEYTFTSPLSQRIVTRVILGKQSPLYYQQLLHTSIGWDISEKTTLGRFLWIAPGFSTDEDHNSPRQLVDDKLAQKFAQAALLSDFSEDEEETGEKQISAGSSLLVD